MSELGGGSGRAANGGGRAQGPVPVQAPPVTASRSTVITPTEIMRRRQERAKQEQERTQAASEEQRRRLQGEWAEYDAAAAAGAPVPLPSSQAQPTAQAASSSQHRRSQSAANPPASRTAAGQPASSSYPPAGVPPQEASSAATRGAIQPPVIPSSPTPPTASQQTQPQNRPRASTTRQVRPVQATAGPSNTQRQSQPVSTQRPQVPASAQETPQPRSERDRLSQQPGLALGNPPSTGARRGDGTQSTFPHAFERWEILSSKWEGMTSYWINRLQMNSEELHNQPMVAQLSRQVTDLSAAGANLFTALVEIQKLRASSERKFQRWFNDTKHEMERQQEMIGQLERAVIQERRDRAEDQALWEKRVESAQRTEVNSSRLNAEKDRELQIAKDESRRAWEELGRYEALERERQKALAQGLPVEIGGYTVYPKMYPDSRQESLPQQLVPTRDDTRPTSRRGPQASTVQDDPFIAQSGAGEALHADPRTEGRSPPRASAGPTSRAELPTTSYSQPGVYNYEPEYATPAEYTSLSGPPADPAEFYHQSNAHLSYDPDDDGYERDEHGNIVTDAQGRPVSYRRGLHEARSSESDPENGHYTSFGHDPADYRHRIPTTNAQQASAGNHPGAGPTPGGLHPPSMQTRPETDFGFFREDDDEDEEDPEDRYSGAGYGQLTPHEAGQHYHPTRLSDVPEEDEASRASEAGGSRGGHSAPFSGI